jgi:hypothetical protein
VKLHKLTKPLPYDIAFHTAHIHPEFHRGDDLSIITENSYQVLPKQGRAFSSTWENLSDFIGLIEQAITVLEADSLSTPLFTHDY